MNLGCSPVNRCWSRHSYTRPICLLRILIKKLVSKNKHLKELDNYTLKQSEKETERQMDRFDNEFFFLLIDISIDF
jgi:hypothetical protein